VIIEKSPLKPQQSRDGVGAGVSAIDSNERTIYIADARRYNGKHFVVRADEKLTAFIRLESAMRQSGALRCGRGKTGLCQKHQVALV
jgi:hypothetical protein